MKTMSCIMLLLFSSWIHAAAPIDMQVSSKQKYFTVTLPSNRTTGYYWRLTDYDKSRFILVKSKYEAPNTKLMGAGGKMLFFFIPRKENSYPLKTTMRFNYSRSWETTKGEDQIVTIEFLPSKD